ncbi:MAG TPA: glutamine--fructose-6-phosphate transaminase (isomerizing) [Patescibacteria group bacterium]|nr:glutamine--fructose-6-phosphate transaminase (isomerizing) [Patescibacteria group bacterium]
MCGIFSYIGSNDNAASIIVEGLKRLDYRGYDSWGVAVSNSHGIFTEKRVGKIGELQNVKNFPKSFIGIGHTRWATTGAVTQPNAHPHFATDKSFALAQNGIVENYEALKKDLIQKGYTFKSETDTEVIVYVIEEELKKKKTLQKAILSAFKKLKGRNTIILVTKDKEVYAARNGSPLVVGFNGDDIYLSSDTLSFAKFAKKMLVIENGQMVQVNGKVRLFDIKNGKERAYKKEPVTITSSEVSKDGFDHFMIKEIFETPGVLEKISRSEEKPYLTLAQAIKKAKHVYTIGSGSTGIAAAQVAFYLRSIGKIQAVSLIGADAVEYAHLFTKDDLLIALSQSGETADVLEVLELAKEQGITIASHVNMPGSIMTRMSDYKYLSEAGPEICVMATKTFSAQVAWGYLLAKTIRGEFASGTKQIAILAQTIQAYLTDKKNHAALQKIAEILVKKDDIFLLGKYQTYNIMREGMVKIVEAAYKHGHALPSGDLKHYVITLMEPGVPVIVGIANDKTKTDLLTAISEVRLRGAEVIAIAAEKNPAFDSFIPVFDTQETMAMMILIPLQLLAYYLAKKLGNSIDKPRNIAKSVTVK